MTLEIQTLLRLHGLDHVKDYLKLEVKEKGDLVLLKYNTIEADWTKPALYECRGIILDRANDWAVAAYPYRKFFNLQEGYCAEIDWDSTIIFDKMDGSLITVWFYNGEWRLSTSGTIDADSSANGGAAYTFADLVWKSVEIMYGSKEAFLAKLDTNFNYMFELMTPFNLVVAQHTDYKLILHGARDMRTLKEIHIHDIDLVKVKVHSLKNVDEMVATFDGMTWQEEGYIGMDKNFNRFKLKNPAYVAAHHTTQNLSPYHILAVVKTNELSEFLVYFPGRTTELLGLQEKYDELLDILYSLYTHIFDYARHLNDREYAELVFKTTQTHDLKTFSGLFFNIRKPNNHTIPVKTLIRDYVNNISDKDLYKILNKG